MDEERGAGQDGGASTAAIAVAMHRGPGAFPHTVRVRGHTFYADELPAYGGHDSGPDPTELLAAALASCTSMTLRTYAERKGWSLDGMTVSAAFHEAGEDGRPRYAVALDLPPRLADDQIDRLRRIAEKCPVRRALSVAAHISDEQLAAERAA